MAVSTGFITIADIADGNAGVQAIVSNENQTFAAGQDGGISGFSFSTVTQAFVGTAASTYVTGTTPAAGQYGIGTISALPSDHGLVFAVTSGVLNVTDGGSTDGFIDAGSSINNVTITVPFIINTGGNDRVTVNRTVTLSKAMGGSANFVVVASSTQTITYSAGSTTPQSSNGNIVINATSPNITTGTFGWSFFSGTPGATSAFTTITNQATISGGANAVLTVTPAQYQALRTTNGQVVFRATREGTFDQISVVALFDGARGGNAVNVEITVIAGNPVFRNNTGSATLRADLYVGGIDVSSQATAYQWLQDGTNVMGGTNRTLVVPASAVADDGASLYSCMVTFPDSLI